MNKWALIIIIIFSKDCFAQFELKFGLIDDYCKKYEINVYPSLGECTDPIMFGCKGPIIDECKYRSCPKGLEGEDFSIRTIIGKANSGCAKIINPVIFYGRAFVNDYELSQNLTKCVLEGDCNDVIFKQKFIFPDDFSEVGKFEILRVDIKQSFRLNNSFMRISVKSGERYYVIEADYNYNIIHKGELSEGFIESRK